MTHRKLRALELQVMRALAAALVVMAISASVVRADERMVFVDEDVNFAMFATFAMSLVATDSSRPELTAPTFADSLAEAIRTSLAARGLRELRSASADLMVKVSLTGIDFHVGPFGRVVALNPQGRGGRGAAPTIDFTEATLVIDVQRSTRGELLWRGIYRVADGDGRVLVNAIQKNIGKLVSQFPRKRS
jgi:hypothetical protein